MPLDFPNSPTNGQIFTSGIKKWQWSTAEGAWLASNYDNNLLTLINELSTNMQNIGNYPYLEYAWVTAPDAAAQTIPTDTETVLTLNTEVADTGNNGNLNTSTNQITLNAGTYQFEIFSPVNIYTGYASFEKGILSLYNVTNSSYITRKEMLTLQAQEQFTITIPSGQVTLLSTSILEIRFLASKVSYVSESASSNLPATPSDGTQRTTIKLWKVG